MSISTQPYKGARDFYPEDMRLQKYIFKTWRDTCERFGYEEYNAPILEPTELYEAKSGQEIVNEEMYTFVDRGGRQVAMRPEMTPTVSRMVAARRQELAYPVRWYSIPNLWRYDRPQRGRLREHWQLNVDIFGVDSITAEHELISLADAQLRAFGAKRTMYEIRVNSRKFVDYLLQDYLGLNKVEAHTVAKLIDKMHKLTKAEFYALIEAALTPTHRELETHTKLISLLSCTRPEDLPEDLSHNEALDDLAQLMVMLEKSGVTNARFDITLMRGFDYYTDIVFEVFDLHPENNRSMFGGGRYDGLVGMFGVEPVATVGFGQGDVGMELFLESHGLLPKLQTETELFVALLDNDYQNSMEIIDTLRSEGVNVFVDITGRKVGQQLKSASKKGINFAIVIGENEVNTRRFKLKNLITSNEQEVGIERMVAVIKDKRVKL